jgi:hypothetical protein
MIWLTWRQHRAEALTMTLLVTALCAVLLVVGNEMHAGFVQDGASCVTQAASALSPTCQIATGQFLNNFGYTTGFLWVLYLVPAVIGAFAGAPLLARELESGTWQLAWTQAVPRLRWLGYKLAALAALTVALQIALTMVMAWYHQPWTALYGRWANDGAFDFEGLSLPAYALFAFAAGTAAGTLLRRSVPALAVTIAAFAAVRYGVENWLRPHYQAPLTALLSPGSFGPLGRDSWLLSSTMVDARGSVIPEAQQSALYSDAALSKSGVAAYLHAHGVHFLEVYQPGDRFWTFQLTEAGIYVGLAAILLAVVFWRVRRRLA